MELVDIPDNPLPRNAVVAIVAVGTLAVRVARWMPAAAAAGTVMVCPGRGEFIEKYAGVVADLLDRHFAVVVIDWRGQGASSRLVPDRRKGHVGSFAEYRADLDAVVGAVLRPHCPRPFIALAHSMGGAIVLDHAARGGALFDRIVLSAPMLSIFGLKAPRATRRLAAAVVRLGGGGAYVPGGSGRSWMTQPFAGNLLTSDEPRYRACAALAAAAPGLVVGAPTFGWLHAAFEAMAQLDDAAVLRRIIVPVLAVACGADVIVGTPTTQRVVGLLPRGAVVTIPGALHEILMEADRYRSQFWRAFDGFVAGAMAPSRTAGTN